MDILTVKKASTFHSNKTKGWIIAWQSNHYEHVYCAIYSSKAIAITMCKFVALVAYLKSIEFEYTVNNTKVTKWDERGRIQIILYTPDQTLMEYTDQDVYDLVEDGFIDMRNLHTSMLSYYKLLNS